MTAKIKQTAAAHSQLREIALGIFNILILILSLSVSLFYSERLSHAVSVGLSLCVNVIIPSVFPFMILADIIAHTVDFSRMKHLGAAFERIFHINRAGLGAFLLGIICGFPLGVKHASELYLSGKITRQEAERLTGFCNNTGPAFLISGIGAGLRGSVIEGIILYLSMLISAVLVGFIFRPRTHILADCLSGSPRPNAASRAHSPSASCAHKDNAKAGEYNSNDKKDRLQHSAKEKNSDGDLSPSEDNIIATAKRGNAPFSLSGSICSAGSNTLAVCSYLVFFSCICGTLRMTLGEGLAYLMLVPWLEVGNASGIITKSPLPGDVGGLALTALAVGFSGLSVHMQAMMFISKTDISTKYYYIMKIAQGVLCAALAALLHFVIM